MKLVDIEIGKVYRLHRKPVKVTAIGRPQTISFNAPYKCMVRCESLTGEPLGWYGSKALSE